MKRFLWLMCLGALACGSVRAQDDRLDDLSFDEVVLPDEEVPYFAVGLGVILTFSSVNTDELDARNEVLGVPELNSPTLQWGAEFFSALGFVKNTRLGFSYMSGTSRGVSPTVDLNAGTTEEKLEGKRAVEYNLRTIGVHADYAWTPFSGMAVLPGIGIGFGTQTITSYQSANNRTWSNYDSTFATSPDQYSELSRQNITLLPRLNIEYALTPFLAVRGNASYTLQISDGEWVGNRVANVSGMPDTINMNGFNAQVGLFLGLFNN